MAAPPTPTTDAKRPDLPTPPPVSIQEHWRAGPFLRRAKALGGLAGFGITALAGYSHGAGLQDLLWHGLIGGVIGWLVAWGVSLVVWRQLIPAETRHLVDEIIQAKKRALEREQARRAAQEAAMLAAAEADGESASSSWGGD